MRLLTSLLARPGAPLFVYGQASTGKTLVVEAAVAQHRHVMVSCVEAYSVRVLFGTILDQLVGHRPTASNGFRNRVAVCVSVADFVDHTNHFLDELGAEHVVLVLDNAERLRDFDPSVLSAILRLGELTRSRVTPVLVSQIVFEKFREGTGVRDPIVIHFPQYTFDNMIDIVAAAPPHDAAPDFFRVFVRFVCTVFYHPCRDLVEIRYLCHMLFPQFRRPVEDGVCKESDTQRLYRYIAPYFQRMLDKIYLRQVSISEWLAAGDADADAGGAGASDAFDMPRAAKQILIAAYLASFTSSREDGKVFAVSSRRRRTRRSSRASGIQKAAGAGASPAPFPLERLLAIHKAIFPGDDRGQAFVLSQIASLVTLGLILQTSAAANLDAIRYRANVSLELVFAVARDVDFDISKFFQGAS